MQNQDTKNFDLKTETALAALAATMRKVFSMEQRVGHGYNDERDTDPVMVVAREYRAVLEQPAKGTLKAWMQAHDKRIVHTVQVALDGPSWAPTGRRIDASLSGKVRLGESFRYYAGMRVLKASEDAIIVADSTFVILYVIDPR